MRNQPHRRIKNIGGLIVACLALLSAAAGCGGGGSSEDPAEAALRKKLESAGAKLNAAKSFRVELPAEAAPEGDSGGELEEIFCIELALDGRGKPASMELRFFEGSCSGGGGLHSLIVVGNRAWASSSSASDSWTAATITPAVLDEFDDEQTDLKDLFAAAEDIEAGPGDSYRFEAPAEAFPGEDGLGDLPVEFEAVIDGEGFLSELSLHAEPEGGTVTAADIYDEFDQDLGIAAPDPSEVHGRATKIRSKDDLERFFGGPST